MNKLKIKSIKKSSSRQVYDLTVEDNHNFFITDKKILTHNCDYLSPNAQAALRGVMEEHHETARFILTCVTGDTKVTTPEGMRRIDSLLDNTNVASFDNFLESKTIKKSISNTTRLIKTAHGFEINATPDHKFFTLSGEKIAKSLHVGDSIPVYAGQLYGNSFNAEDVDYNNCFSKTDFYLWLTNKGVITEQQKQYLIDNKCFVFDKSHFEIFNYIVDNNLTELTLVDLANSLGKSKATVRNLFCKLEKYITNKQYVSASRFVYSFDTNALKKDYAEFDNFVTVNAVDVRHINKFINTVYTVENIIEQLNFDQFNADLLLSLGRIAGFMEGDGHLSTTLHLAANNRGTLEKVHRDLLKFVDVTYNCSRNGVDSKGLCSYYNNRPLKLLLEYIGVTVGNKTTTYRKVPALAQYKLFFKGFLQGLYDADGKSIKVLADNISVSPVLLTQSIVNDDQVSFLEEIALYAAKHFDLEMQTSTRDSYTSTFGSTGREMHLYCGKTSQVKRFLETIGNYYDKQETVDVMGYLQYKMQQSAYGFLTFAEWRDKYYGHGIINDSIVSIEDTHNKTEVYDCCLEDVHWYVTNGFMSHNCNYPNRVIPALHSRCQGFHIAKIDQTEFTARVAQILIDEKVEFDLDTLDTYVKATYPDLRKCINMVQMNSQDSKLISPNEADKGEQDWKVEMVDLFKAGKIQAARQLLCGAVRPEEMEEIYTWLYANVELLGKGNAQQDQAVLIIKQGLVDHALVADPEINLAAVLIKLARNLEK